MWWRIYSAPSANLIFVDGKFPTFVRRPAWDVSRLCLEIIYSIAVDIWLFVLCQSPCVWHAYFCNSTHFPVARLLLSLCGFWTQNSILGGLVQDFHLQKYPWIFQLMIEPNKSCGLTYLTVLLSMLIQADFWDEILYMRHFRGSLEYLGLRHRTRGASHSK